MKYGNFMIYNRIKLKIRGHSISKYLPTVINTIIVALLQVIGDCFNTIVSNDEIVALINLGHPNFWGSEK